MAAGIFSFVFGAVAKMPSDGKPYFLFSYCGLLGWNLFNSTVTRASTCLIGNAGLVSKIYFPRLILPFSTLPSALLDFFVALGMLAVLMALHRTGVSAAVLLFPGWIILVAMLAMGVGLWTSALSVSYRDVQYVLPVVLQLLLYATPIAYAVSAVPPRLRTYLDLNPLSSVMEGIRWSLLGTPHPDWRYVLYSAICCLLVLASGAIAFKNMERRFADVI
jgi:lipopolysaccharide transport system permease protein